MPLDPTPNLGLNRFLPGEGGVAGLLNENMDTLDVFGLNLTPYNVSPSGDTTGVADTAALGAALAAGDVVLKAGTTYYVNNALTATGNVIGNGATLKVASGWPVTTDVLTATGATNKRITGLLVDGSSLARWGISVDTGTNVRVTHNVITACTVGIRSISGTDNVIAFNRCYSNSHQGIVALGSSGTDDLRTLIQGNTCNTNGTDTGGNLGWGINVSNYARDFVVTGNRCRDNYQGGITCDVIVSGTPLVLLEANGVVTNNNIRGFSGSNASHGISYQGDIGGTVSNNVVNGAASNGIFLNGRYTVCTGNVLRNNGAWGLSLHGSNGASAFTPTPAGFYSIGPNVYDSNASGTFVRDANTVGTNRLGAEALPFITLPPASWSVFSGTPSIVATVGGSHYNGWSFANGAANIIIAQLQVPDLWAHMSIEVDWTNLGAGSGNVVWRYQYKAFGTDGDNLNAAVTNTVDTTIAAPSQDILKVSQLATNGIAVTPGQFIYLRITRLGTSGSDTLGNAAALVRVLCQPVWS